MSLLVSLLTAVLKRLLQHGLESLLVVVAIALGVAALTAVNAMVVISQTAIAGFPDSLVARQIVMLPNVAVVDYELDARPVVAGQDLPTAVVRFTYQDMVEARDGAPTVDYGYVRGMRVMEWHQVFMFATFSADFLEAARIRVVAGSLPTVGDFEEERNVLLITPRYAARMGIEGNPVGQEFTPFGGTAPYTIIGILPDELTEAINVREAMAPFRRMQDQATEVYFAVENAENLEQALLELETFVRGRWGDAVRVESHHDYYLETYRAQRARSLTIALFATVSLVAAAFNIIGLMLARIARRQREIGVKRSLGATRPTIGAEVLLEGALLGVLGGVLGAFVGYWLLGTYNAFLSADIRSFGVQIPFSVGTVAMGAVVAVAVSMIAASYPAVRATRVNVVDALREV